MQILYGWLSYIEVGSLNKRLFFMSRKYWLQNVGCGLCLFLIETLYELRKQEKQTYREEET